MDLLIVDDEESAIEAVRMHVNWEKLPFQEVYTAMNINAAKEKLQNTKIKIVLCDIEMPMGSGLDLLEWINENRRDVLCIFMTCHAEFSYAQKAIRLGGVDYILKPLDFENLTEILKKTAERVLDTTQKKQNLEEGRKATEQQFWMKLFSGDIAANREEINRYIDKYQMDIQVTGRFLPLMIFPKMLNDSFSAEDRKLQLFSLKNACGEIFATCRSKMIMETMADGNLLIIFCLGKDGSEKLIFEEISARCKKLEMVAEGYLQMEVACVCGNVGDIESVPEQLENIYSKVYYAMRFYNDIPMRAKSYYRMSEERGMIESQKEQMNEFVSQTIEYVKQNLREELTMEMIAEQVHLNADYLNRIFKKETGYTLSNYVIKEKMEYAKFLLRNTDWSISDVAAAVGYYNYSSFNRSFKKMTGKSPQDWRKNC